MSSFHERQKSLFNTLKDAEDQCNFSKTPKESSPNDYGVIDRRSYRRLKHEMKQFRNRESIFKRPEANIRSCLRPKAVPDHIKNPQGYVYYSLSDVTPDQMSDSSNTNTALSFLREMEDRDTTNIKMGSDTEDSVFKKPTFHLSARVKREPSSAEEDQKVVFKGNKLVLPEYVVGASQKKVKKERNVKKELNNSDKIKNAELKLGHLYDEEED